MENIMTLQMLKEFIDERLIDAKTQVGFAKELGADNTQAYQEGRATAYTACKAWIEEYENSPTD